MKTLIAGLVFAGAGIAFGAVHEVATVEGLKAAVAGAAAGDTVRLAPGEYVLDATLEVDRELTMEAPEGGEKAVISGDKKVRIIDTTARLTLRNLRLEHGYFNGGWGAGVLVKIGGSLDVEKCHFVSNVQVSANWAHCGGAIAFKKHDDVLGGLGYDDPASSIRDSVFFANDGGNSGGAILGYSKEHNRPWGQGLEVRNCIFRDNRGNSGAGIGVFRGSENLTVWNSVFHSYGGNANTANPDLPPDGNPNLAGGKWNEYDVIAGSAFGCQDSNGDVKAKFFNCMFIPYYTWSKRYGAFGYARSPNSFDLEVSHCVQYRHPNGGADDTIIGGAGQFQMYGDGNVVINSDNIWSRGKETFVDAEWMDYRPNPVNGSYLIDRGKKADWMEAATDIAGAPRMDAEGCDIGPVEYHPATIEVGAGREIQSIGAALAAAGVKSTIKVDDGVYEISEKLETSLNGLTIEGNNADPGAVTIKGTDGLKVRQLVRLLGDGNIFSGFTLTGAHSEENLTWTDRSCGAIAVTGASCVSNCVITGNSGWQQKSTNDSYHFYGGVGAYLNNMGASIVDCRLTGNAASNMCGIVLVFQGTIERCEVDNNTIWVDQSKGTLPSGLGSVVLGKGRNDGEEGVWDAVMRDCEVHHNSGYWGMYAGSGVYVAGQVRMENTKVHHNTAYGYPQSDWETKYAATGISTARLYKHVEIDGCVVSNCMNATVHSGYGICGLYADGAYGPPQGGKVVVRNTVFTGADFGTEDEKAGWTDTGIVHVEEGVNFLMENCRITGNRKNGYELVRLLGSKAESCTKIIRNTLIAGNEALGGWHEPIIKMEGPYNRIENCTIADNSCPDKNAGVFNFPLTYKVRNDTTEYENAAPAIVNCVIAGNTGKNWTDKIEAPAEHPEWKDCFTNCCVSLESTGLAKDGGGWWGEGNFAAAVRFADPENGDWGIRGSGSPLVNKGKLLDWMSAEGAVDLAGLPRISGDAPDIGCYEYQIRKGMVLMVK